MALRKMWISEEFSGSDEALDGFCQELTEEMKRLARKHGIMIVGGEMIKEDLREPDTEYSPFPI